MRWLGLALLVACGGDDVAIDASAGADGPSPPDAGPGEWEALLPLPGGPRQETAVVERGGLVYVIGGFDDQLAVVNEVEIGQPFAGPWLSGDPMPVALHHCNAAVVGQNVYVLGALSGLQFDEVGAGYVFDGAWSPVAPMPAGSERGSAAIAAIGDKIYVAGGYRAGASVADFSVYDATLDTWTPLLDLPEARNHAFGAAVDGVFYVIGGRTTLSGDALTGRVDAFDPSTGQWSSRAPMPTARSGTMGGVIDGIIYVVGGEVSPDDPMGVFPDNEAYDPATDTWTTHTPMRTPRHGAGAAVVNGKLIVPGGATQQAFGATAIVEAYTP